MSSCFFGSRLKLESLLLKFTCWTKWSFFSFLSYSSQPDHSYFTLISSWAWDLRHMYIFGYYAYMQPFFYLFISAQHTRTPFHFTYYYTAYTLMNVIRAKYQFLYSGKKWLYKYYNLVSYLYWKSELRVAGVR